MSSVRVQGIYDAIERHTGVSFPNIDRQREAIDRTYPLVAPAFQSVHDKVIAMANHAHLDAHNFPVLLSAIKADLSVLDTKIDEFGSASLAYSSGYRALGDRLYSAKDALIEKGQIELKERGYAIQKECYAFGKLMSDAKKEFSATLKQEEKHLENALKLSKKADATPAQRTACIAEWMSCIARYDLSVEANIFSASSSAETVPVSMKIIDSVNKELFPAIVEIRHMIDSYDERFMICFDEAAVAFLEKMQKHLAMAQNKMEHINRLENDYFAAVQRHKLYLDEVRSKLGCDHGTVRKLESSQELLDERCRKVAEATKIVRDLLPLQKDFIEKQLAGQERLRLHPVVPAHNRAALLNMLIPRSKPNGAGAASKRLSP